MTRTVGIVTATPSTEKDWKSFEVRFDGFANLPAEQGEDVLSHEFMCFGHKWCLWICPGGDYQSDDGMVAAYLCHRSKNKSVKVQCGLFISDEEGNTKKEWVSKDGGTIFDNNRKGSFNFCRRSKIIDSLVNGTLIITVRMKCNVIAGTVSPANSADKEWKSFKVSFDGSESLPATKGERVYSPEFTCLYHKWRLGIYPGGSTQSDDGMMAVYLEHRSNTSITVDFGFTIRDKEGNTKKDLVLSDGHEFLPSKDIGYSCYDYDGWYFLHDFCERSDIIDPLVDYKLTIEVRMKKHRTKTTDNGGGKESATIVSNPDKQSAQQSAHKNNKNTSAEDNPEHLSPLKKMRT